MRKMVSVFGILVIALALLPGKGLALPLCVSGPLSAYAVAGFGCDFAGATWSNFSYGGVGGGGTSLLSAAQVTVTPSQAGQVVSWAFTGAFATTPGGFANYSVGYDAAATGFQFEDTTVALVLPGIISNGDSSSLVRVTKQMQDSVGIPLYGQPFPEQAFSLAGGSPVGFKAFSPHSAVGVIDELSLVGGSAGSVSIAGFQNSFTLVAVPAPPSAVLVGTGLLGLALLAYRSRARRRSAGGTN